MLAYVDSSVWITLIEGLPEYQRTVKAQLDQYKINGCELAGSYAVLMEIFCKPYRQKDISLITVYTKLLKKISLLPVHEEILEEGFKLVKKEGLKAMDSIHVALAIHHNCDAFITTDTDFRHLTVSFLHLIALPKVT